MFPVGLVSTTDTHIHTVSAASHTCGHTHRCHVGQLACIYVRLDGSGGEAVVCMCTFLWILAELNC